MTVNGTSQKDFIWRENEKMGVLKFHLPERLREAGKSWRASAFKPCNLQAKRGLPLPCLRVGPLKYLGLLFLRFLFLGSHAVNEARCAID